MKTGMISVIVPVHNGQAYLKNCIDSIACQSYGNLEILVVNDGSTDGTAAVCEGLVEAYGNVRVLALPDRGVSAARNLAMDQAQGEFVTFVDADDRLCPDTLGHLHERITASHSDLAGCRFALWSTESDWQGALQAAGAKKPWKGKERRFDRQGYLADSILMDNCRCWSKLYRRELVEGVRFREGLTVGEDMLFLLDLLPGLEKAVETEYPGYGYYQNPGGVMQRPFTPSYMDQIRCWETAEEIVLRQDGRLKPQMTAKIITAVMLTAGKIAMCTREERRKAREYLIQCREVLQGRIGVRESFPYLPEGYRVKAELFCRLPGLYVWLYRVLQMVKFDILGKK